MNPPHHQPEVPKPVKARVSGTDARSTATPHAGDEQVVLHVEARPGRRRNRVQIVVLVAFMLGLVALATWGFLSRREGERGSQGTADILPKNSVALINSSTP